jgi:predicted  nucleic acid-binding Zn-ribbon protein
MHAVTEAPPLVLLARQDARLFQLRQQVTNLPRRIQELGGERSKLEVQLREAEGRHQQAEAGRRKVENEQLEYKQRRAKSESRLATLTSTEQYQALKKEIESHDDRILKLDDQILAAMERSEETQRALDAERVRVQQAIEVVEEQRRSLLAELEAAKKALPEETRQRETILVDIDPKLRTLYERILKAKGDAGLALVTGSSCGICKAVQPPQMVQVLRQGGGLHTCQMCGRLLVWDGA